MGLSPSARLGSVFSGGNSAARHGVTVPLMNGYVIIYRLQERQLKL